MNEPLLDVRGLTTSFETGQGRLTAVDDVSFSIEEGEVFGVVGESGSGKSVTALSVMRLLDDAGTVEADEVWFDGTDLLSLSEAEMRSIRGGEISMIFQDPMTSLNPVMTIGEQIAEVVRHHGDTGERTGFWSEMRRKYVTGTSTESRSWRRAIELLETVGIPEPEQRATEYPHQLSGGMRQRVVIAQALAGDPSLIIADEPTTALDVSIEAQILNEILELSEEFGISVMLITHDLGVVRETCDRVAVMYASEFMETGHVDDLFEDPHHPYTEGLLASIPRIDDDREWLSVIEGTVPDLIDKPSGCPFQDRCDYAFELCDRPLVEYELDSTKRVRHAVRCHRENERVRVDESGHVTDVPDEAVAALERRIEAENDASNDPAVADSGIRTDGGSPTGGSDEPERRGDRDEY
ncbi:peptide/nickel transport system ATP-binding protein [Halorubrum aquaticum]|uniref:Nickel import system ATP-binding protein NikD n=1 Tax=Halorubrum aquaticum TaxID=387340 RepID=A0A1I3ACY1_9EURY|nr:ABC transporter ATP-binding protein [Halorubrum aquaticum]SFH47151.1 peptide/nickel transport system ATP-binding protein [Halorubrum aquaticum]